MSEKGDATPSEKEIISQPRKDSLESDSIVKVNEPTESEAEANEKKEDDVNSESQTVS